MRTLVYDCIEKGTKGNEVVKTVKTLKESKEWKAQSKTHSTKERLIKTIDDNNNNDNNNDKAKEEYNKKLIERRNKRIKAFEEKAKGKARVDN